MKKALFVASLLSCLSLIILQCSNEPKAVSATDSPSGKELAQAMCSSCHKFPQPDLLDRKSWEMFVLPRMGYFLGHYDAENTRDKLIEDGPAESLVLARNIFPESKLIDSISWEKIKSFYLENSPVALPKAKQLPIAKSNETFTPIRPAYQLNPPSVTALYANENNLMIGDAFTGAVHLFNKQLQFLGAAKTNESPVWISENENAFLVTVMGSFSPTDAPSGALISIPKNTKEKTSVLIRNLQRPVHHAIADFDNDGNTDFVICEFAKWTGSLSWYKNLGGNQFEKRVIRNAPGSMKAYPTDWNGDGHTDIIALFGQGNEGIWAFINDGNGNFTEQTIKHLPPSFGSSFLKLQDLNSDGKIDLVYCAGDNADFGPIIKPYHGIYLWFNDGENHFNDSIFLPLNGAYSAIPRDFDQDGDLDIASISFFPNYAESPEESFVYFENKGDWTFNASSIKQATAGRWIVMETNDLDGDKDLDLILASLAFEVPGHDSLVNKWVQNGIPFIVLENKTK